MRCADGGEAGDGGGHFPLRDDEAAGIDATHAVGEQMNVSGPGLLADAVDLFAQFYGALLATLGIAQGSMKDFVTVMFQVRLNIAKVMAAIFRMAVAFGKKRAIALMQPVKAGDAVDEDDGGAVQAGRPIAVKETFRQCELADFGAATNAAKICHFWHFSLPAMSRDCSC